MVQNLSVLQNIANNYGQTKLTTLHIIWYLALPLKVYLSIIKLYLTRDQTQETHYWATIVESSRRPRALNYVNNGNYENTYGEYENSRVT